MVGFACSTEKPSALPNTNLGDFSTFQHLSIFLTSGFQRLLVVGLYQDENRKQHIYIYIYISLVISIYILTISISQTLQPLVISSTPSLNSMYLGQPTR